MDEPVTRGWWRRNALALGAVVILVPAGVWTLDTLEFGAARNAQRDIAPGLDAAVQDWTTHLDTLVAFWSSVLLRSGTYRGNPMSAHRPLDLDEAHFERWLALWGETARESLTPPEAAHVSALAQRIGQSLRIGLGIDPLRRQRRAGGAPACMNGDAGGSADQPA